MNPELFNTIFQLCILPLLTVLTTYLVKFINAKSAELTEKTDNQKTAKYIKMLSDTITNAVIATNQTYVNSLKDKDAFTKEAQAEAFKKTYDAVQVQITGEAEKYLSAFYGDLNAYITNQIEASVNQNRQKAE